MSSTRRRDFLLALVEDVDLPVEIGVAFLDTALAALDLIAALLRLASHVSRSLIVSSFPATTAALRSASESRVASSRMRRAVSSAVDFAATCAACSARFAGSPTHEKKRRAGYDDANASAA